MAGKDDSSDSDGPLIDDNIIRIQLRKSCQRKWELRTRNLSPGVRFPTIQLFDCDGNLLVETNDENISIRSSDFDEPVLKTSRSLKDFKHYIKKKPLKKHNTISGGKIYTRVYRIPVETNNNVANGANGYVFKDNTSIVNIPRLTINNNYQFLQASSLDTTPLHSDGPSEVSSYKSSDNDTFEDAIVIPKLEPKSEIALTNGSLGPNNKSSCDTSVDDTSEINNDLSDKENELNLGLNKSRSFNDKALRNYTKDSISDTLPRSKSGVCVYKPHNKVPFLNTYLKSLPVRNGPNPDWFTLHSRKKIENSQNSETLKRRELPKFAPENWSCKREDNSSDNEFINIPTDVAADCEMKKRLKMYRRGISEMEPRCRKMSATKRRHSVSDVIQLSHTSSSDSVDEADLVLNRLKRRILVNRMREKRRSIGAKYQFSISEYIFHIIKS